MPNADQNYGIDLKMSLDVDQCQSTLGQGISKTLVKTVNTLQWQQHCLAKTFNFHCKAWTGAATSLFPGASHDQCRSLLINANFCPLFVPPPLRPPQTPPPGKK